ncbi:hypothetical protein C0J52_08552 [Blattella germanica]|nr:hypothetical protein C0J52_08552 [Blattella germanica]
MAQHIPLEKSSESTFAKAIKNIKHYIKDKEKSTELDNVTRNVPKGKGKRSVLGKAPTSTKPGKHHGRGVVYLRHIPKGFHEKEMNSYFSMFGRVTRLKLVRTEYIPAEKVHRNTFWNAWICPDNCPRTKLQHKWIEKTNRKLSEEEVVEMAKHELKRLEKLKKQMGDEGISFDCQVDGILQTSDNLKDKDLQSNNEFANGPVLVLDESDDEIEYKIHPNVTVIRREPSKKKSVDQENRQNKQNKPSPTKSEGKKSHKRSLSSSSVEATVPRKRMSLLDRLKSKPDSSDSSPAKLGKKTIVELMGVDRSPKISTPKQVNSSKKSSAKKSSGSIKQTTPDLSTKKYITPKIKLSSSLSSKKSPKTQVSSSKEKKTPTDTASEKKLSSTVKKKKMTPLLVGKRLAFSTSKKKSGIPRLTKIQK